MTQEISVQLSASIIYVTGTVNGVSVEFTLAENNTWCAVVEKSENQIYDVEIIGYDSLGQSTIYATELYYGFSVITDRTEADKAELLRVRAKIITETWEGLTEDEKTYWFSNPKGAYNISDLNRVGNNMVYLADFLNIYGYAVGISPKTDWDVDDIPTQSQMSQLLADLQALEDSYYTLTSTPAKPANMNALTHVGANNIEQILLDINTLLENMIAQFKFSDTFYCGEV